MKKNVLLVALCVCLAAIIACGSLAYFTSTDSKTNKFMTAEYDPENPPKADDIFSVEVIENATKDPTNPRSVEGTPNDEGGYDYEDLLPGSEAAKKVTIKNTGMYSQYARVKVTVTKAAAWKSFFGADANLAEKLCDIDSENWTLANITPDTDADSVTYTYNYAKGENGTVLASGAVTPALFTKVTVPAEKFDADDFANVNGFAVTVLAEAIQADYMESIGAAFTAFDAQNS